MSRCLSEEERAPLLDGAAKYLRRLGVDDFDIEILLTSACRMAGHDEVVAVRILQDGEK
jgi:hypothetical protein